MSEPQCDGQCTPDLCIYHAGCPRHGAAVLKLAFGGDEEDEAERLAATAAEAEEGEQR